MKNIFKPNPQNDLQRLLTRLENNGIDYLLSMMDNNENYSAHIAKATGNVYSSDDAIAWHAFRQAEKLNKTADIQLLLQKLEVEEEYIKRSHVYFCLSHLCKNTVDKNLFNILMDKLSSEAREEIQTSILIGLVQFPKDHTCNIEPIKELASNGTEQVRAAACHCLRNTESEGLEDFLIDLFNVADNDLKSSICIALETCASERSILTLQKAFKNTRSKHLKTMIERVLVSIPLNMEKNGKNA